MLIVAPTGTTKSTTSAETPARFVHFIVRGIVTVDEAVPEGLNSQF